MGGSLSSGPCGPYGGGEGLRLPRDERLDSVDGEGGGTPEIFLGNGRLLSLLPLFAGPAGLSVGEGPVGPGGLGPLRKSRGLGGASGSWFSA